ncbi:phage minor tail protein L [Azotobacter chroococcum]|uniref:phage minor tail protein L n=1 Tax=Azotobacter chroococcum TaxID=353 RepID=UPI000B60287B|nr:phage minor tail protein L [Azotobacter chroococcum]ASL26246.1 phage minor tail protein L [Azotobacter chroococcum]
MLTADVQQLEPGSEVRLYELDATAFGGDLRRFHGHRIPHTPAELEAFTGEPEELPAKSIWWNGEEYAAWPVEVDGLEVTGDGRAPTPTLRVGNIGGSISALCLLFDDLLQAKVIIRETFAHYLDAENFPDGNPQADPTQEKVDTWYIDQKTSEDGEVVEFALSSPGDVQGQMIPARQIHGLCSWALCGEYRGADCGYTGGPVSTEDGTPTDDPALDACGGLLSDCKARFGADNPLPHGGFPASALIRS